MDNSKAPKACFSIPASREQAGAQIGPYELMEAIGEGAMGTVFLAEQSAPVKRRVALKLIKSGRDSGEVVAQHGHRRWRLSPT